MHNQNSTINTPFDDNDAFRNNVYSLRTPSGPRLGASRPLQSSRTFPGTDMRAFGARVSRGKLIDTGLLRTHDTTPFKPRIQLSSLRPSSNEAKSKCSFRLRSAVHFAPRTLDRRDKALQCDVRWRASPFLSKSSRRSYANDVWNSARLSNGNVFSHNLFTMLGGCKPRPIV